MERISDLIDELMRGLLPPVVFARTINAEYDKIIANADRIFAFRPGDSFRATEAEFDDLLWFLSDETLDLLLSNEFLQERQVETIRAKRNEAIQARNEAAPEDAAEFDAPATSSHNNSTRRVHRFVTDNLSDRSTALEWELNTGTTFPAAGLSTEDLLSLSETRAQTQQTDAIRAAAEEAQRTGGSFNPSSTPGEGDDLDALANDILSSLQTTTAGPEEGVRSISTSDGTVFDIITLSDGTQQLVQQQTDISRREQEARIAQIEADVQQGNLASLINLFQTPAEQINFITNLGRQLGAQTVSTRDARTGRSIIPQAVEDLLGLDGSLNIGRQLVPSPTEGVGEATGLVALPRGSEVEEVPFAGAFNQLSDSDLEALFAVGSAIGLDVGDLRRQSRRLTPRDGLPAVGRVG